jgi:hypothetical protein
MATWLLYRAYTAFDPLSSLPTIHWHVSMELRLASAYINVALVRWYLVRNGVDEILTRGGWIGLRLGWSG